MKLSERRLEALRARYSAIAGGAEAGPDDLGETVRLLDRASADELDQIARAGIPFISQAATVAHHLGFVRQAPIDFPDKLVAQLRLARERPDADRLCYRPSMGDTLVMLCRFKTRRHAIDTVTGPNWGGWRLVKPVTDKE